MIFSSKLNRSEIQSHSTDWCSLSCWTITQCAFLNFPYTVKDVRTLCPIWVRYKLCIGSIVAVCLIWSKGRPLSVCFNESVLSLCAHVIEREERVMVSQFIYRSNKKFALIDNITRQECNLIHTCKTADKELYATIFWELTKHTTNRVKVETPSY